MSRTTPYYYTQQEVISYWTHRLYMCNDFHLCLGLLYEAKKEGAGLPDIVALSKQLKYDEHFLSVIEYYPRRLPDKIDYYYAIDEFKLHLQARDIYNITMSGSKDANLNLNI